MKLAIIVMINPNNDITKLIAKFSFISCSSLTNTSILHIVKNAPNNIVITKRNIKTHIKKNLHTFIVYCFIGPMITQSYLLPLNSEAAG